MISFDYTSIDCNLVKISFSANQADQVLKGVVVIGGESFVIDTNIHTFDGYTPKVVSISPTTVTESGTTISFLGSWNIEDMDVTIGGVACDATTRGRGRVECTMPDLPTGFHKVRVSCKYGAVVMDPTNIESELDASAISPTTSGIWDSDHSNRLWL